MRILPNQSEKRFVSCLMKNGQISILHNPIKSATSSRMNPNESEPIRTRNDLYRISNYPCESIGLKFIPRRTEIFRFIPISVSEPMRILPNQSEKRFIPCLIKNGLISILLNPIKSETSSRMNRNESEPIRTNPNSR